jgi:hypothetical protein
MNGRECFEAWAGDHEWSDWTKPTLFATGFGERSPHRDAAERILENAEKVFDSMIARNIASRAADGSRNCVVVDCPGEVAIAVGARLAGHGFAPVVLFNGVSSTAEPLVRNGEVVDALAALAPRVVVQANPPPAFLLDSRRQEGAPQARSYDNRWLTFPQDFPSAGRLRVSGIKRCYLLAAPKRVADDLAHVLRRWQESGIEIYDGSTHVPTTLEIKKPLWFRQVFYRWVALSGLRPNAFGGFGAAVPSQSGGGGLRYYG